MLSTDTSSQNMKEPPQSDPVKPSHPPSGSPLPYYYWYSALSSPLLLPALSDSLPCHRQNLLPPSCWSEAQPAANLLKPFVLTILGLCIEYAPAKLASSLSALGQACISILGPAEASRVCLGESSGEGSADKDSANKSRKSGPNAEYQVAPGTTPITVPIHASLHPPPSLPRPFFSDAAPLCPARWANGLLLAPSGPPLKYTCKNNPIILE
ncbi:hypothetical protein PtA15_11A281 [Puccinia triticina]|uniref:Uncharacterized protein n=1 Tax=Puccinia triticina TaxID=208348 RepID=A0ABY7CZR9_9BASI|nr:uncharacterized protein PtA15_11A281 [Puccinia triticina]WAQ89591.1 hypothetical protein PtA15_11A281 [Puccinia triticina]WAR59621.1 hypothetical protein PtB15_11B261 [Puccinia triticina]